MRGLLRPKLPTTLFLPSITRAMVCLRCYLIVIMSCLLNPAQAAESLILGVHPYLQHQEILHRFQPLADYLGERLRTRVSVKVGQDYQSHIDAIGQNRIDIAYLGPVSYVKLLKDYGHKPILGRLEANGKPTFRGHIIVRENSNLQQLNDLIGHSFAFGDPNSTMSSLVPRAMLLQRGIDLAQLRHFRHFNGHDNVALAVLTGDADAGAVKEEVYFKYRSRGLRSLAATPEISEHLFVARSNMSLREIRQISNILQSIDTPNLAERLLTPIKKTANAIVTAAERDYAQLSAMIQLLEQGG